MTVEVPLLTGQCMELRNVELARYECPVDWVVPTDCAPIKGGQGFDDELRTP